MATSLIDDSIRRVFRDLLAGALQQLIGDELTTRIGAGLHERTDTRTAQAARRSLSKKNVSRVLIATVRGA